MSAAHEDELATKGLAFRPMSFFLYAAGGLLVAAAIGSRNPVPLFLALPLLLAPIAAALSAPRSGTAARLQWGVGGSGPEVDIHGEIALPPGVTPESVRLRFFPAPPLVLSAPLVVRTEGHDKVVFDLTFRAPYPCLLPFARPDAVWEDPLGLVEVPLILDARALQVERYPPEVTRLARVRLRRTTSSPGEIRSRTVGGSGEFFAVRAAGPGDTARQINWWATARSGRLLSNDYQLERTGDLLLLLDLRPTTLGVERDTQLLAISRAAALGIADSFLNAKSRVGLGLYDEFLTAIPLGTGRVQRHRIASALQKARLAEVGGPPERFAVSLRRYFPPGVTTLLLSSLPDDDTLFVLPHLRRRGFPTFVLSPSPLPLLRSPEGSEGADEAVSMRLLRLARRQRLGAAWREAPVVEWEDYWSLGPLVNYLQSPARSWTVA